MISSNTCAKTTKSYLILTAKTSLIHTDTERRILWVLRGFVIELGAISVALRNHILSASDLPKSLYDTSTILPSKGDATYKAIIPRLSRNNNILSHRNVIY